MKAFLRRAHNFEKKMAGKDTGILSGILPLPSDNPPPLMPQNDSSKGTVGKEFMLNQSLTYVYPRYMS